MNEETLFHLALTKPAAERAVFLDAACGGDARLRRRVDDLVRAHDQASCFLLEPPVGPGEGTDQGRGPRAEGAGSSVGPYRLVEQIGEGGMGTVFRAEQSEPVARQVAVKIIKPGLDTGPVIARFEAERQALAMMDHPNIAKVLEAGSTASGRPYFVMELVEGVPITEYCDAHRLPLRERLELFIAVCQAVQHAHQKGIIHRDLKPANVLVARYDGRPVPKVIDFGLAKATEPELSGHTRFTRLGFVVGTLEYMSPEQAETNQLDIDTRSDIYSLGVMLYELLTGTTPIEHERLKRIAFLEMLRYVREEDPPTPSTRLTTTEGLPSIAARRGVRPQALCALVRGELDWIVMQALDKDRTRRYEAASALAQDLRRHLDDEPVLAFPPSTAYRLRKLARKHRAALQVAAGFLLLLIAGVVASLWQAVQATRAREVARTAEGQAMDALRTLTDEVIERQMARQVRLTEEDRAFLGRILAHYERFAATKGDHLEGRLVQAEGSFRVAMIRMHLGERQAAVAGLRRASELYGSLATDFPADPAYRRWRARTHNNLSILLADLGQASEAEAEQRLALGLESRIAAESPQDAQCRLDVARSHANLATLLMRHGKWADAEAELRRALAIGSDLIASATSLPELRPTLATAHAGLGTLMRVQGRRQDAEAEFRGAIAIWAELVRELPGAVDPRRELARSHSNLSTVLRDLERTRDAAVAAREALQIQTRLAAEFPAVPGDRCLLATSHNNLASLLLDLGETSQAEAECRRALGICERLVAEFSGVPEYVQCLAVSHNNLGNVLHTLGKAGDAEAAHRTALELRQRLVADFPTVPSHAVELGGSLCNLGNLLQEKEGELAEALVCFQKAIQTLGQVLDQEPRNASARLFLCNSYQGSALTLQRLDRHDEAFAQVEKVIEFAEGAARDHYLLVRINLLVHTQPVAAMTQLEELLRRSQPPAADLLTLARLCSLASGAVEDEGRREAYAARAVALLEQALAKGDFNDQARLAALKQDPHLAAVRRRGDFRKLFVETGAGTPAGGKKDR